MTSEEIAIDYARTECCNSCTDSCKKTKCKMFCNVRNAVLYGLAEGREENAEKFSALEKENTKLKETNNTLYESVMKVGKRNNELKAQIEKMKRCEICKHYRWNHCSYETNILADCIQNKLKHFELKEIKEK